jgi:NAD(P)-dependent dehydrogenase (short-subunit alcohol dehydrogenase family)
MGLLDGRVALVTGSARGLGAGIARALAEAGAAVVCADVLDAAPVAASLPASAAGQDASAVHLNVADRDEAKAVVDRVVETYGAIHVLVNNAAVTAPVAEVADVPDGEFERVFAVNVVGMINCSAAAVPSMREQRFGRIINIASHLGKQGWAGWGPYCASKFAIVGLTQCMALELAPHVTVNAICPGTMEAPMMRYGFEEEERQGLGDAAARIAEKAASLPLGRMGTPEDVGRMAVFVASDHAAFTTGASLNLTGGEVVFF